MLFTIVALLCLLLIVLEVYQHIQQDWLLSKRCWSRAVLI